MTELEAAKQIAEGKLSSPHKFGSMTLWALRATGTGAAYRNSLDEYVWRDSSVFLTDEFVERVGAGLPIIWEHPEVGSLNSEEFADRIIGSTMLGFIRGDEVWCVARLYDDEAIRLMKEDQLSTSPGVVFRPGDGNVTGEAPDGTPLLIEGRPSILDHLCICAQGVWDKGKNPTGVADGLLTNTETLTGDVGMAEHEEKADAGNRHDASEKLDAIMDAFKKMDARLDAMEKERADAKADAKRKDEEEMMDAKKADAASCEEKKDASEEKEEEKEEKEEEKEEEKADKKDSKKDSKKDAKKDSSEEEEKEEKKEDSRKDSAMREENDVLKARLAKLEAAMKVMTTETPGSERDALASAQSRADSVMAMLGDRAPAPMPGEQSLDYRRRLLKRLSAHSPALKNSRFDAADEGQITLFEDRVYADAANSARTAGDASPGVLIPFEERDRAGRVITKFHGDIGAFMAPFMTGAQTGRFNRKPGA